jgi:hypothetical protein
MLDGRHGGLLSRKRAIVAVRQSKTISECIARKRSKTEAESRGITYTWSADFLCVGCGVGGSSSGSGRRTGVGHLAQVGTRAAGNPPHLSSATSILFFGGRDVVDLGIVQTAPGGFRQGHCEKGWKKK